MAEMFRQLVGCHAVARRPNGFYVQCDIYERRGIAYAKIGAGFVKIYTHGGTSSTSINLDPDSIDTEGSGYKLTAEANCWRVSEVRAPKRASR
ncbi:MAG: hypothetical protein AAF526_02105 [Pseudomonadota bacterium]